MKNTTLGSTYFFLFYIYDGFVICQDYTIKPSIVGTMQVNAILLLIYINIDLILDRVKEVTINERLPYSSTHSFET